MRKMFGYGWAMPVVSRRAAVWCSLLEYGWRLSGGRLFGVRKHYAWERAVGVS